LRAFAVPCCILVCATSCTLPISRLKDLRFSKSVVQVDSFNVYNIRSWAGRIVVNSGQPHRAEFDHKMFKEELQSLRAATKRGAMDPPQDLSYTVLVLELLWLIIGAPFLTGALLAIVVGH
jgi:hypothetical protein